MKFEYYSEEQFIAAERVFEKSCRFRLANVLY